MKKQERDNIFEDGIGDLIICDCNVSEKTRESKQSYSDELIQTKIQRNKVEKGKQFYKNAFGISIVIIFIIGFVIGFKALNEQSNKNIQDCLKAGYSSTVCYKMEGIY